MSYSGYNGINQRGKNLGEWLIANKIERVYLVGLALSHCVGATAYDIRTNLGLDVIIATDATRSVSAETEAAMMHRLREVGVEFRTTEEITKELVA